MNRTFENVLRAMIEQSLRDMVMEHNYFLWNVEDITFIAPRDELHYRVYFEYDIVVVDDVTNGTFELCGGGYADGHGVHVPDTCYSTYRVDL